MAILLLPPPNTDSDSGSESVDDAASVWSGSSDTSSDVTEVDQDEIPHYFIERNGRLFHHHGTSPYPLPVDGYEQRRTNLQHMLLKRLFRDKYAHLAGRVLRDGSRALDLCTGTGIWVTDMAHDYPTTRFYGIDVVPIATRHPPDNVYFEMADVNAAFRYRNALFDLVHARSVSMAVTNYPALLREVARVLRPGGLFIAGEWERAAVLDDGRNPHVHIPNTCAFYQALHQALHRRNLHPLYPNLEHWLVVSGNFERVRSLEYTMPVGDWPTDQRRRELGMEFKNVLYLYASSVKILLTESGWGPPWVIEQLILGFLNEINTVPGIVCHFKMVYARRIRNI